MLFAVKVDVVLVFRLLRRILYPENEETIGDGENGGGGEET